MTKSSTLTDNQKRLVESFATFQASASPEGVKLILDLIDDGTFEFGHEGTDKEHLHVAFPGEASMMCMFCDAIEKGLV